MTGQDRSHMPEEPPPVLGSWPRIYRTVVIYLALLIALFTVFTLAFRP